MSKGISLAEIVRLHNGEDIDYGTIQTDYGYTVIVQTHTDMKYYDLWDDNDLIVMDGEISELVNRTDDFYVFSVPSEESGTHQFMLSQREYDTAIFDDKGE